MPTPVTCTRKIEFDAAHRVLKHETRCKFMHGHRYVLEATFTAAQLDEVGRVIDFGLIKSLLGTWIDTHWDHTTILHQDDRALGEQIAKVTGQTVFYLPTNPTTENLAQYLIDTVCPELFSQTDVRCVKVKLHETPNCYAEIERF